MAEHELKLKATIDTSQVQQQLSSLGRSAGNGININTQQIDQAFNKLAQSLNKLNATFEKAAVSMAKNANTAGGGFLGLGPNGKIMGLGATSSFAAFAAKRGINKVADYYEATGNSEAARNWKTAGLVFSNVTRGALTGGAIGGSLGTIVPGLGNAAGAGIGAAAGAAAGAVGAAFDYLAKAAQEAADALANISNWYNKLGGIVKNEQFRQDMSVVEAGPSDARDEVEKRAKTNKYLAEQWLPTFSSQAEKIQKELEAERQKSGDDFSVERVNELTEKAAELARQYQATTQQLNNAKQILEAIAKANEKDAKAKAQEEAKAQQLKNWQAGETGRNAAAMYELQAEKEMGAYDQKSNAELEAIVNQAEKDEKEMAEKLMEKINKRQEAVNNGDKNLVKELDGEIAALEKAAQMSGKKGDLASKILSKRRDIADRQGDFVQKYNNRSELDTFEKAISNNNGGIGNLKSLLRDLNQVKMKQNEAMRQANDAGDFDKRDRIAADYDQTSRKIDMVEKQIENLKQANIWEGAGQMSEMAKVGMYVSRSDQGMNDPKLQAQKEGNELLRQIKENTANQAGGLE